MATITDFTPTTSSSTTDKIVVGDVTAALGTITTVQDLSGSASLTAALNAAAAANAVTNGVSVFTYGGNQYVYIEATASGTTYTAGDFVVKLTGTPISGPIAGQQIDGV